MLNHKRKSAVAVLLLGCLLLASPASAQDDGSPLDLFSKCGGSAMALAVSITGAVSAARSSDGTPEKKIAIAATVFGFLAFVFSLPSCACSGCSVYGTSCPGCTL